MWPASADHVGWPCRLEQRVKVPGMRDVRVVLIGGTSHVGKSTIAHVVADRLGYESLSTDGLARHPGRPYRTPERQVPAHVAEHYSSLTADQLITSVLDHYERLWPRIEDLVTACATSSDAGPGLVVEGSALWPVRVATLTVPATAAVWLTAAEDVLRARVYWAGRYEEATGEERRLMEKFVARTERYQRLMVDAVDRLGLERIDVGAGRSVAELADAVLAAVTAAVDGRGEGRAPSASGAAAGDERARRTAH
jgi:2-phosphoglycerate kinase